MANVRMLPPEKPRLVIEVDMDEAEDVLAVLDGARLQDAARDKSRSDLATALVAAGVERLDVEVIAVRRDSGTEKSEGER